ncbi:unnamed protein product [Brassicogethes aeneus]|uniref:Histone-lysine N-methyltransferase eggless n=1 Tax=Brassicogethes aeneus TaxID=1431903 RepID=A0A9P0AUN7_BRAAE|nr:unnamed protein product [Brassicogethes aeneus]
MDVDDEIVDDPMEIEDTVAAPIIERSKDDFCEISPIKEPETNENQPEEPLSSNVSDVAVVTESLNKDEDVVVLLDDDDEAETEKAESEADTNKIDDNTNEIIVGEVQTIDLIPHSSRCLNTVCESTCGEYVRAPNFCLSYFRVKQSKSHKEEICKDCYDQSILAYDKLANNLQNGELILNVDLPIINETLQIEDSDEDEGEEDDKLEYLDEENFDFIKNNIDDIIAETLKKYEAENHMTRGQKKLEEASQKTDEDISELSTTVKDVRAQLDKIQLDLYNQFRPDLRELKALSIIDDSSSSVGTIVRVEHGTPMRQPQNHIQPQQKQQQPQQQPAATQQQQAPAQKAPGVAAPSPSSQAAQRKSARAHKPVSYAEMDDPGNSNSPVVAGGAAADEAPPPKMDPPKDLPAFGAVEKPPPKVGMILYIYRQVNPAGSWIRARLMGIIPPCTEHEGTIYAEQMYRLTELKQQKDRLVSGKQIAYMTPCAVRLSIGTRVLSVFKEDTKKTRTYPYYPGVVGEAPYDGNKYRYLIFFDIGYAQYVDFQDVHLIVEVSKNVWDDMNPDSRPFIKKYLESQDRPMVKLAKDQTVRTEYNGKWWLCTVINVDCSLVRVYFEQLNRMEWIYRGSTRLSPMFREEQAATNRLGGLRTSRKAGPNESATVVQYTRPNDFNATSPEKGAENKENKENVRAVARKSTTRPQITMPQNNIVPFLPSMNKTSNNVAGPTSKIMYFTPRDQVITKRVYKPHTCGPRCRDFLTHNINKLRGHNPLSKPLLCGWARLTSRARGRKDIVYKAPCGRSLRNIAEVHYYLRVTRSEMTVDLFDFNHMVRCLAEFSVECKPDPVDLSKGLEQVPIPVINGVNNDMLDFCNYSTKRVPMEGVHINLNTEFLCGCDCEDDCIDKTKCACWRLTLEGTKYMGKDVDPLGIGYIYRRLVEQVITGIYECNPRCKCNQTCLNRVVQNPMSLKLQVFRTHNRGWGIRCLNDVPQGTFICIYAGTLHTEQMANEDGMAYGDEYFAELDYIETVEKVKEDYEAEAMETDDEDDEPATNKSGGRASPEEYEEPPEAPRAQVRNRRYSDDNDFVTSAKLSADSSGIRSRLRRRNNDDDEKDLKDSKDSKESKKIDIVKQEFISKSVETLSVEIDTVTISDDEDEGREVLSFNPKSGTDLDEKSKYNSVRDLFGPSEEVYIMDAKNAGNIGRFLNHSCSPNVFVQNVFVDTQDPRFPWVAFFSSQFIRAGTELTWNYNYDIGSVPGRVLYCHCASLECKGRLL